MALEVANLIYPIGELQPALFPDRTLESNVQAWLAEAAANQVTDDQAVRHWVYYRAYAAVAQRLAITPTTETYFNEISRTIAKDRIEYFEEKADENLSEYNRLTDTESFLDQKPAKVRVY